MKSGRSNISFSIATFLILLVSASLVSHYGSVFPSAYADTTTFARTYGGENFDEASSVQQTPDGGYIVAGFTGSFGIGGFDFWILKLDPSGEVEWEKTYGTSGSRVDWNPDIQVTSDNGFIVAGESSGDFWVMKLTSAGDIEWEKTFGTGDHESAPSVQQTDDGGYIVAGSTHDFGDARVLKLDSDGNAEWEKSYGGVFSDLVSSIHQTSDGGFVMAGATESFGAGDFDLWVVRLESDGDVEWEKIYGGTGSDAANSVQQTDDGGYIVAGFTDSFGGDDAWFLKLDTDGNVEWEKAYGSSGEYQAFSVKQTSDGGYIVAGEIVAGFTAFRGMLLKVDPNGNIEWDNSYAGNSINEVWQTSDGGYVTAGSGNFGAVEADLLLLKVDSDGNIKDCVPDLIKDAGGKIQDTSSDSSDSEADVGDTFLFVADTDASVQDTSANIGIHCGIVEPPVFDYSLSLFEQFGATDGVVGLNQGIRAEAETTDFTVDQVSFRLTDPAGEIVRELAAFAPSFVDEFTPDVLGDWILVADFHNGKVLAQNFSVVSDSGPSWDGGGDGINWSDCANWSGDACPTDVDSVTIGSGSSVELDVDFALGSGRSLNIASGGELTILPAVTLASGISSIINNHGTINNLSDETIVSVHIENNQGGVINNYGTLEHNEVFNKAGGVINNEGASICDILRNNGTINNNAGATIGSCDNSGLINGATGIVNNSGNIDMGDETSLHNDGVVENSGRIFIGKDVRFTNLGTIIMKCGGVIEFFGGFGEPPGEVINEPCAPYELTLYENNIDPSDLVVNLGDEVKAVAKTDDAEVFEVRFRWINPGGEVARGFGVGSVNEPLTSAQDTFTPDEKGAWTVEVDFGNGQIVRKTLDVSFFVVPESPVGAIAIVVSSLAVLGLFARLRGRSNS